MIENEIQYNAIMARIGELLQLVSDETSENDPNYIELMVLTDIVKNVNQKESLDGLLLHGVVRGIIQQPEEYAGVVLSSGEFAVLDLYAVTCKQENHFGNSNPTMLTPQGSIIFIFKIMICF